MLSEAKQDINKINTEISFQFTTYLEYFLKGISVEDRNLKN